jgi:hypothetical protein
MKLPFLSVLIMVLCAGGLAVPGAFGQAAGGINTAPTGPLAGLEESTMKLGFKDKIPAKLCGMLWPTAGTNQQKFAVKKVAVQGKDETEKRILIVRLDNYDIIIAHFTETKPTEDSKIRRESYYRTTAKGDLVLALKATFQFSISDVDNDVLKDVTFDTYGETAGDGETPLPMTPDIKAQFMAERKFWLKTQKSLKKQEQTLDQ